MQIFWLIFGYSTIGFYILLPTIRCSPYRTKIYRHNVAAQRPISEWQGEPINKEDEFGLNGNGDVAEYDADTEPVSENHDMSQRKISSSATWSRKLSYADNNATTVNLNEISPSRTFDFRLESSEEQQYNLLGSLINKCVVKISCTQIKLKKSRHCKDEYLIISDGLGGDAVLCGTMKFGKPKKSSQKGHDLFIKYKGNSPKTVCTATCNVTKAVPLEMKKDLKPKFEKTKVCECGKTSKEPSNTKRIIGGVNAEKFEFPWQVAIIAVIKTLPNERRVICGASLINDRYVLTAAHCFSNNGVERTKNDVKVLLHAHTLNIQPLPEWKVKNVDFPKHYFSPLGQNGSIRIPGRQEAGMENDTTENSLRLDVEEVIMHPLYSIKNNWDYDLALLRLNTKIDFLSRADIRPVCLETWDSIINYSGMKATVSGWGKTATNVGAVGGFLQKLVMKMYNHTFCQEQHHKQNITTRMMCAGDDDQYNSTCTGDSGGPLSLINHEKFMQIGVVSWALLCGSINKLGLFSQIREMRQWIQRMVDDDARWCK